MSKLDAEEEEADRCDGGCGTTSRCSVKLVYNVIAGFNEEKRNIVKSIGFDGLLFFPMITKLNLKLFVWLLSRVDECRRAIVIDTNIIYEFDDSDVHKIFGISCEGTSVRDKKLDRSESVINTIRSRLGITTKDGRSLKVAQAILEKEHSGPMSNSEIDAFKTAFVVFDTENLFAPTAKHDYSSLDFWPALLNPVMIQSFNWSQYVIKEICEAATKLKADLRKKNSVSSITGCPLFLQIFYPDSLDLGNITMPHDIFPRIRVFTNERLKSMILADSSRNINNKAEVEFGASNPRNLNDNAYCKLRDPRNPDIQYKAHVTANNVSALLNQPETETDHLYSILKDYSDSVMNQVATLINYEI